MYELFFIFNLNNIQQPTELLEALWLKVGQSVSNTISDKIIIFKSLRRLVYYIGHFSTLNIYLVSSLIFFGLYLLFMTKIHIDCHICLLILLNS